MPAKGCWFLARVSKTRGLNVGHAVLTADRLARVSMQAGRSASCVCVCTQPLRKLSQNQPSLTARPGEGGLSTAGQGSGLSRSSSMCFVIIGVIGREKATLLEAR